MDNSDRILGLVRQKGPLLPVQINKDIGVDVLVASAMLGELCDKRLLRLSKLKIGGSPLYFLPGQESKLMHFSDKLNEKDNRAYERLKSQGVLHDAKQDALFRTALRNIPDFAVPLEVNSQGVRHIFWKWYLLPNQDAEKKIMNKLGMGEKKEDAKEEKKEMKKEETRAEERPEPAQKENAAQVAVAERRPEQLVTVDVGGATHVERKEPIAQPSALHPQPIPGPQQTLMARQPVVEEKLAEPKPSPAEPAEAVKPAPKAMPKKEESKPEETKEEPAEEIKQEDITDEFHLRVLGYFTKNDIKIESTLVIRTGSDIEFIIHLPTSVGLVPYFCKAKNKKKCSDDDVAKAFLASRPKKLPTLFLYTGDLTKKAKEIVATEFRTVVLREV